MNGYMSLNAGDVDTALELTEGGSTTDPLGENSSNLEPESAFLRSLRNNLNEALAKRKTYVNQKLIELLSADILSKSNIAKQIIDLSLKWLESSSLTCHSSISISLRMSDDSNSAYLKELHKISRIIDNDPVLNSSEYFIRKYQHYILTTHKRFLQLLSDKSGIMIREKPEDIKTYDSGMVLEVKEVKVRNEPEYYYAIKVWWRKVV